ncbi:hypothetical protein FE257_006186 [Aspergillus nanangensis]|uniref:Uncharacterized protein n=1 Tax=Aspergillus nanangensis TaxID=2582783 RepID=A0AAD4CPW1_ASPNN|nr:hypothetical protein FE257_006186 [Aspergillus nanangensis]
MDSSPLDDFDLISENIYLHEPTSTSPNPTTPLSPTLIILCTWLGGATNRRVSKYVIEYQQRFPTAYILLLTTEVSDITFRSFNAIRSRLAPAREAIDRILQSVICDPTNTTTPSTLLHAFSHGGSNTAVQLTRSMDSDGDQRNFLSTLRLIIFDCSPGDTAFCRSYKAAALSLPTTEPANTIGKFALYPTMGLITSLQNLGIMHSVADLRSEMNDPTLFGAAVRRLYMYSQEDEMVRWTDVERHMDRARAKGFPVEGVRFESGPHCALVMVDGPRYWRAVQQAWEGEDFGRNNSQMHIVEKCKL